MADGDNIARLAEFQAGRPAAETVPLAQILDQVHAFLGRFVAYPSPEAHDAHVLWIAHCHCMAAWESTPRIAFLSPEPASGKTRALEASELLTPNPVEAVNVTPAYLFRKVGDDGAKPTVLFDEVDAIFGKRAKEHEDVRALLNAGHRRGAIVGRCVMHGKVAKTEEIPAYSAVALAGLGWLPDTLLTRSVIVRMRPRLPSEKVSPFRRRVCAKEGTAIRDRLAAWGASALREMTEARPEMPDGIEDRNADVFEALLAIADAAGEGWPERARVAAVALVAAAAEREPSLGIRLLSDLYDVFGGLSQLPTSEILSRLHDLPEAPWNDLKGKPLNDRGLAFRLREYGVRSKSLSVGDRRGPRPKGYTAEDLHDAWARYVLPLRAERSATSATPATPIDPQGKNVADTEEGVADVADDVAADAASGNGKSPSKTTAREGVADVAASGGNGGAPSDYDAVLEELAARGDTP